MLKKILIVFAILIALLISFFVLLNIFYPLDKSTNANYQTQTAEKKEVKNQVENNTPEVKTQLFNNEDYGYSFSYPESLICEYNAEPANVDFGENGEIINYTSKPRTDMITCALKNRQKRTDSFSIMFVTKDNNKTLAEIVKTYTESSNDDYVKQKGPVIVTDVYIANQAAKKIITEEIIDNVDEWYDETYLLKYQNNTHMVEYFSGTNSRAGLDELKIILDSFQFTK